MRPRSVKGLIALASLLPRCCAQHEARTLASIPLPHTPSISVKINSVLNASTIFVGHSNASLHVVDNSSNDTTVSTKLISPLGTPNTTIQVDVTTKEQFIGVRFNDSASAAFYGVWEYPFNSSLDSNGIAYDLKGVGNSDGINWCNARAPFFISSSGYGVFADTEAMGSYNFSTEGQAQFIFNTSSLTYYIISPEEDGSVKTILEQYVKGLSDTITMPDETGYGPIFWSDDWREDFHGNVRNAQENVFDVVDHLAAYQIRALAVMADRPYGTGSDGWGNFDFDPAAFPDPKGMIANLSATGLDFQVWVANRAYEDSELYNKSKEEGWLFNTIEASEGPALNLSIPEAYNYLKQRMTYFPDIGIKGYKIDRGEEGEMPVYEQNVQITLFDRLCYEVLQEKWGDGNFYNFGRNVPDKSRKWANVWNGDASGTWEGLSYSVTSALRAGLMGFSQWGSDTGGYNRGDGLELTEEVWARWMWFSAFSPMYEFLLGGGHTPWYSPYTNETVAALKATANLHHDLIPYIQSFTHEAVARGIPVMRALLLEVPEDDKVWSIHDEYFFGTEFLVAPIITEGGHRTIYFPEGTKYLEYFNKTDIFHGGDSTNVTLGLDAVPAYVRAGAIVPRGDVVRGNAQWIDGWTPSINIEFYPGYGVKRNMIQVWTGMESVPIEMESDGESKTVTITYGALGIEDATYTVFTGNGTRMDVLNSSGGNFTLSGVDSLFD